MGGREEKERVVALRNAIFANVRAILLYVLWLLGFAEKNIFVRRGFAQSLERMCFVENNTFIVNF